MTVDNNQDPLDIYQRMVTIRLVELRLGWLFANGEVPGFRDAAVVTGINVPLIVAGSPRRGPL